MRQNVTSLVNLPRFFAGSSRSKSSSLNGSGNSLCSDGVHAAFLAIGLNDNSYPCARMTPIAALSVLP